MDCFALLLEARARRPKHRVSIPILQEKASFINGGLGVEKLYTLKESRLAGSRVGVT